MGPSNRRTPPCQSHPPSQTTARSTATRSTRPHTYGGPGDERHRQSLDRRRRLRSRGGPRRHHHQNRTHRVRPRRQPTHPYFWKEHDGDREEFEQSVRDHRAVAEFTDIDGQVDAHLYKIKWTDEVDGFLSALRDQDILLEEASTTTGETWLFRLRAVDQDELSAFQQDCYNRDVPLDVQRVVHNPDMSEQARGFVGVTPKQEKALELALERGYFNVPSDVSADDLGEELGITGQAFTRRLQRGHSSILTNLFGESSRQ